VASIRPAFGMQTASIRPSATLPTWIDRNETPPSSDSPAGKLTEAALREAKVWCWGWTLPPAFFEPVVR